MHRGLWFNVLLVDLADFVGHWWTKGGGEGHFKREKERQQKSPFKGKKGINTTI